MSYEPPEAKRRLVGNTQVHKGKGRRVNTNLQTSFMSVMKGLIEFFSYFSQFHRQN